MKNLIGIVFVFCFELSFGQINNLVNERVIGGLNTDYFVTRLSIPNSTDYFIIACSSSNISSDKSENSRGDLDMWVVKLNNTNDIIWDKTIGGSGSDVVTSAIYKDSLIYITARSNSPVSGDKTVENTAGNSFGAASTWLVCIDLFGNIIWQKTIDNNIDGTQDGKLLALKNNNLLVSVTRSSGNLRFDELNAVNGDSIVTKFFGFNYTANFGSISQDSLGNLYLMFQASSGTDVLKSENGYGSFDTWILKLTESYNKITDKCFGGSAIENGGMGIFKDNFIYLFIGSYSGVSGNKSTGNSGETDCWIVKTDLDLNIIWDKSIGGLEAENPAFAFWENNGSNNILLSVQSKSDQSGSKTSINYGLNDSWVARLDVDGNILDQTNIGGSADDYGQVFLSNDLSSQNAFCSTSASPISGVKTLASKGLEDIWLFNFNADELLEINEKTVFGNINIYPNPFQDKVTFSFPEINENLHLKIVNIEGKTVYETVINNNTLIKEVEFPAESAAYFYQISGNNVSLNGKLFKVK